MQGTNALLKPVQISAVSLVLSAPLTQLQKLQLAAQGYCGDEIIRFGVLASHSGPLKYIQKTQGNISPRS